MKKLLCTLFAVVVLSLFVFEAYPQGVVISTDESATPNPSAMLDVQSSAKGFLPPRMTTTERNSVVSPASGLVVYDTNEDSLFLFNGTDWEPLVAGSGSRWEADGDDIYRNIGRVGIGTNNPEALLHTLGTGTGEGNVVLQGEYKSSLNQGNAPLEGIGTRLMWYPDKAALRAGYVSGANWDTDSIGVFSMAFGYNTKAFGDRSTAFGRSTTASGAYSTSMGRVSAASGNTSTALGEFTVAPSYTETAIGRYNSLYEPLGGISGWNNADRLFVIGKGTGPSNRSDALVVLKSGNTGIGTSEPEAMLHVAGSFRFENGSQAPGRVLTSDASGNASWSDLDLYGNNTIIVDTSGNGNFTTISAALNSVTPTAENPATILVKPGTYFEEVVLKSHVRLVGEDENNVLITGWADAMPGLNGFTYGMLLNSVADVQVRNMTIRSNSLSDPYLNFGVWMIDAEAIFENVHILGDYNLVLLMHNGIKAENAKLTFSKGSVLGIQEKAIQLTNSNAEVSYSKLSASVINLEVENGSHLELKNSHIGAGGEGVVIQSGGEANLVGNTFDGNYIGVNNYGKLLMAGNQVQNTTFAGVNNYSNATITGNYFNDCVYTAIMDNSTGRSTITGNHIENSSHGGYYALHVLDSDPVISSNVFHNNTHGDILTSNIKPWLIGNRGNIGGTASGIMSGIGDMRIEREGDHMILNLPEEGNVGIGTPSPNAPLHVQSGTGSVRLGTNLSSVPSRITLNDNANGDSYIEKLDQGKLRFRIGGTSTRMTITPEGRVGIGTQNPLSLFQLQEGANALMFSADSVHKPSGALTISGEDELILESYNDNITLNSGSEIALSATNSTTISGGLVSVGSMSNINLTTPLAMQVNGNTLYVLGSTGVGIRTTSVAPWALAVNGNAAKPGGGSWAVFSDSRLKHHIKPIKTGMLDQLLKLRGYTFEYEPEAIENRLALPGRQTGLIAQEVQQVFPEWVESDDDGYLYVTERGLTAIIVEALRELREEKDAEITELQSENEELASRLGSVEKLVYSLVDEMNGGTPGNRDVVQSSVSDLLAGISEDKSGE